MLEKQLSIYLEFLSNVKVRYPSKDRNDRITSYVEKAPAFVYFKTNF